MYAFMDLDLGEKMASLFSSCDLFFRQKGPERDRRGGERTSSSSSSSKSRGWRFTALPDDEDRLRDLSMETQGKLDEALQKLQSREKHLEDLCRNKLEEVMRFAKEEFASKNVIGNEEKPVFAQFNADLCRKKKLNAYRSFTRHKEAIVKILSFQEFLGTLKLELQKADTLAEVSSALQEGSSLLSEITENFLNLDTVDTAIENMREAIEKMDSVESALGSDANKGNPTEDAELEAELALLTSVNLGREEERTGETDPEATTSTHPRRKKVADMLQSSE